MQEKAKLCIVMPKVAKKYAKSSKNMLFFTYKTLVLLKKTVKIDVSNYESVQ